VAYDDDIPVIVRRKRPSRAGVIVTTLALVALAGATLYFAFASHANRQSAQKWRTHAEQSDKLLSARTHQLNTRSTALNRAAKALSRSQADVKTLESRQRSLANEKAQVEDQRGAMVIQANELATLAGEQRDCSNGLTQLLNAFAAGDYATVNANSDAVGSACQKAQQDFDAFQSQSQ
jgi:hypothetical protein